MKSTCSALIISFLLLSAAAFAQLTPVEEKIAAALDSMNGGALDTHLLLVIPANSPVPDSTNRGVIDTHLPFIAPGYWPASDDVSKPVFDKTAAIVTTDSRVSGIRKYAESVDAQNSLPAHAGKGHQVMAITVDHWRQLNRQIDQLRQAVRCLQRKKP